MNLPLALVLFRALATLPVSALIAVGRPETDRAALSVFVMAAGSDAIDGRIARARGEVSALGAALDPLADKTLVAGTLAALAVRGLVPPWAVGVVAAREILAIWARMRSTRPLPSSIDAKAKTTLQLAAVAATLVASVSASRGIAMVARGLLMAAVALTVFSGVRLMRRAA